MKTFVTIFTCIALWLLPAQAMAQSTSETDAMRAIVEGQLQAFAMDRDDEAYSFAAPIVKGVFPTVEVFMTMVKQGYRPVYRNSERHITSVGPDGLGRPSVRVQLTAEDGKHWEALYTLEKQGDGTWKISGCVLLQMPGTDV